MKVLQLGKTHYEDALRLQKKLFQSKLQDSSLEDIILITEHFPVYTKGKTTQEEHLKNIPADIPVYEVERGGSVTFHGPGQIVVYPVVYLKGKKLSVKNYVWTLEQIMIETLKEIGIHSFRIKKRRGVFTDKGKIGFIGVKISRNVAYHGFSLNVNVDKTFFKWIVPCGISDIPVCNMTDFVDIDIETVKEILIKKIKENF
ncbi:lipoyl(octanoyl) transferase LipB [Persephonella atlantica]|uniref:Octanoyltransferase n=1 Tax=Persephonella atlantica TaxID=2699429 RepID=A0ABS1GI47_9AQUI|nr:lipoyl(octanoyl) transferase LipB [Persephonella atlantica]MBK3332546.1 lipoyl(octanoyl) transferase LipB [Persephonella atlantica]